MKDEDVILISRLGQLLLGVGGFALVVWMLADMAVRMAALWETP